MKKIFFISLMLLTFTAALASAQTRDGTFQTTAGSGVAFKSPVRYDMDLGGEYFLNDTFSVGINLDLFLRNGSSYSILPFTHYHFELSKLPRFSPYIGAGLGTMVSRRGPNQAWLDLMLPDLGFLYEFNPHFYAGPNASFHLLTGSTQTWDIQVIGQIGYRF